MTTREQCENVVNAADRGKVQLPFDGGGEWLALRYVDCCRSLRRFDLAAKMVDLIGTLPGPLPSDVRKAVKAHRAAIAAENSEFAIDDGTNNPGLEETATTAAPLGIPPIWIRGWNFAGAMTRYLASGRKRCTRKQIDKRLAICQACPHLVNDHCRKCGCACNEENKLMNKLALASSRCPIGKWNPETK